MREMRKIYSPPNNFRQTILRQVLVEKARKTETETLREQARSALDNYRQAIFPSYETAINAYL